MSSRFARIYWQHKNGRLVDLSPTDVAYVDLDDVGAYAAWDRTLSAWVCYAR